MLTVDSNVFSHSKVGCHLKNSFDSFWSSDSDRPHVVFLLGWNYIMSDELYGHFTLKAVSISCKSASSPSRRPCRW